MKNFDSKLFRELQAFKSTTRFLLTGTPLQNNLQELWSLLHFLLPKTFSDWDAFDTWFEDLDGLADDAGTKDFIESDKKAIIPKMHFILQPYMLRRLKKDVLGDIPKKREYVLYAPMTVEQEKLYKDFKEGKKDMRKELQAMVLKRLTGVSGDSNTPEEDDLPRPAKRKEAPTLATSKSKSTKSQRESTPSSETRSRRKSTKGVPKYVEADPDHEDELSDREFEERIANELAAVPDAGPSPEEIEEERLLCLASKSNAIARAQRRGADREYRKSDRQQESRVQSDAATPRVQRAAQLLHPMGRSG